MFAQVGLALVDHLDISGLHFHLIPGQKLPENLPNPIEAHVMYAAYSWATTWLQERFWEELKNRGGEIDIMQFLLNKTTTQLLGHLLLSHTSLAGFETTEFMAE